MKPECSLLCQQELTHLYLFWAACIHSLSSYPIFLRSILMLISRLRLVRERDSFSHDFSTFRIALDFYRLCEILTKIPCLPFGLHSNWIKEGKETMQVLTFYFRLGTNFSCNKIMQTFDNTSLTTTKWGVTSSATVQQLMSSALRCVVSR
jgi:hypothetical protein